MKIGLSKIDITPPVGCELAGFGYYLARYSTAVYDPLYAACLAVEDSGSKAIIISCDLLLLTAEQVARIRVFITEATGLAPDSIMVCCTHTHSGPATGGYFSLGEIHTPYFENLSWRIARAGIEAHRNMRDGSIFHSEVPCEDIAYNRWVNPQPDGSMVEKPGWASPLKGEVDYTAHVVKFMAGKSMMGFLSYFSVHPVVCGNQSRIIHGDLVGVATNRIEKEHPGTVGIFLQGASGDIDPGICNCGYDQDEIIKDLDFFSNRYAGVIRHGLSEAIPLEGSGVAVARKILRVPYIQLDGVEIQERIRKIERWLCTEEAEANQKVKNRKVSDIVGWRKVLTSVDCQPDLTRNVELMAVRLGGITMVSSPFEVYNGIKQQVESNLTPKQILVVGFANDYIAYAVTVKENDERDALSYAEWYSMLIGEPPLDPGLEKTLVDEMTALALRVNIV
jgi:hypothetical protein